jgi:N-ethylmaleimide reductase
MAVTTSPRSRDAIFRPVEVGETLLANRIVMAPMTRNRMGPGLAPGPANVRYYEQRATAGLIITEATQVSGDAQGSAATPGLYSDEQVAGWRRVTDAVHARGGKIFVQLWHTGAVSHTSFHNGNPPPAPSVIDADARVFVEGRGFVEPSRSRALSSDEIPLIIRDFANACRRADEAGFDGVELHAAHGYLIDGFLRDGSNTRTDGYGGSIENRARFLLEIVEACSGQIGSGRLGVRIAPVSPTNGAHDSDPQRLFEHVVEGLEPFALAFIEVVEGATGGPRDYAPLDYSGLRRRFSGTWMVNNGFDRAMATDAVSSGRADLVSFARPFIANPDLVERLRFDLPLAEIDVATTYGQGEAGYTDYPAQ